MIFTIIIGLLVLVIAYVHYTQGLFSATISAILAVTCAVFAMSFHETLIETLLAGKFANWAHGSFLMLLFALSYSVLRGIFDKAIPGQIHFPFMVDKIGGAVMGLVAGAYAMGIVAIAAQELPFGPSMIGYSPYDLASDRTVTVAQPNHRQSINALVFDEITSDEPGQFEVGDKSNPTNAHSLYVDELVIGTVKYLSNGGSLAGSQTFVSIHPNLIQELFGQRIGIEPGAKRVAMDNPAKGLNDVSLDGLFSIPSAERKESELPGLRVQFASKAKGTLTPPPDSLLLVARVNFSRSAADTDSLLRLSPGSVRLVAPIDADATSFVNYFPVGTLQDGNTLFMNKLDDPLFIDFHAVDKVDADFVFVVKKEGFVDASRKPMAVLSGAFLEVKRLARMDLAGQPVKTGLTASPMVAIVRKELVYTPAPLAPPPAAVAVDTPPAPTPAPAPTPMPAPAPTPAPPAPNADLHSPQAAVAANNVLTVTGATASSSLPFAIAAGDDSSKVSTTLPGGDAIIKNGKFQSLNLDVQETQDKLAAGNRPVKDLLAKDGEGLIIVTGTAVNSNWDWATKADQLNVVASDGKQYPANGVWADVDAAGDKKFYAHYSTNYALGALDAGTGKPGNVWISFSVPAGTEVNQLVLGGQVLGSFNPVKAEGQ